MPDATFPALHIRPARGWLNDPNGVCRIDGRYHVFFQLNPHAPVHGSIHWGHASSVDLLHWDEEPIALFPRPGAIDAMGCWSGSVVDDGGTPTAIYTANPDHAWNAAAVLARSDRTLRSWNQDTVPVMFTPDDPSIEEVRDPFIFSFDGHRYAVQGAGHTSGRPQILLYACDDLTSWTALGALLTDDDPVAAQVAPANIWECPNLIELDGRWVLLVSLWTWRNNAHSLDGVRYLVGDLVPTDSGLRFVVESGGLVDAGPVFYAPQVLAMPDRALLWGWAWELGRSQQQVDEAGWAGVLTFPRELRLSGGTLVSTPAAELAGLRSGLVDWISGTPFSAVAFEVVSTGPWTLAFTGGDEAQDDAAIVASGSGAARVLVDGSIVEVFEGATSLTTRAYPTATGQWVLDAPGGTQVHLLDL